MANPRTLTRTFSDTVSYKTVTGIGAGGVPSYSSLTTCVGKVWEFLETVNRGDGAETVTRNFVHTYTEIPKGSVLWLPGEDTDDIDAGHVVDIVNTYPSLNVRGEQWTIYEIKVE